MNATEALTRRLSLIPGVVSGPSRVGNPAHLAWFTGQREFAHLHSPEILDIRLPKSVQDELRTDPRATFRQHRSAWVEFRIESKTDIDDALRLLRIAHEAAGA